MNVKVFKMLITDTHIESPNVHSILYRKKNLQNDRETLLIPDCTSQESDNIVILNSYY